VLNDLNQQIMYEAKFEAFEHSANTSKGFSLKGPERDSESILLNLNFCIALG
jgi:hypothetical protein